MSPGDSVNSAEIRAEGWRRDYARLNATVAQLARERRRLRAYVLGQPCECVAERGRKRVQCDRCAALGRFLDQPVQS